MGPKVLSVSLLLSYFFVQGFAMTDGGKFICNTNAKTNENYAYSIAARKQNFVSSEDKISPKEMKPVLKLGKSHYSSYPSY